MWVVVVVDHPELSANLAGPSPRELTNGLAWAL